MGGKTGIISGAAWAIVVVTLIVIFVDLPTKQVGDFANITCSFPSFHLPSVSLDLNTLFIIAMAVLIESLLTLVVPDEMSKKRGRRHKGV